MLYSQVKNFLKQSLVFRSSILKLNDGIGFRRFVHKKPGKIKFLCPLNSRSVLKVSGSDSFDFLQGLVTNDMNHLKDGAKAMYALFLNNKSKILYDTLIYRWDEKNNNFLIECDRKVLPSLEKHLRMYKLKRKVQMTDMTDVLKIWVLIAPNNDIPDLCVNPDVNINVFKDPRLADLGTRILVRSDMPCSVNDINKAITINAEATKNEDDYKILRYSLGIPEGVGDLFPGTMFPLEANSDYLHGVSFFKGCYIGQELLARVHFRGVVRKRIMPIFLKGVKKLESVAQNMPIVECNKNKEIGKLKGNLGNYGIGMLRIKEALEAEKLMIGEVSAETYKPAWWPEEAPKEVTKSKL